MVVSFLGNIPNTETRLEHLALTLIQPIVKVSQYLKGNNYEEEKRRIKRRKENQR